MSLLRSATTLALASLAAASAPASAKQILRVELDPGNFVDAATTVDPAGTPTFLFGSGDVVPASATAYDSAGQVRWSFFNKTAGPNDVKYFETTSARHCESGGKGGAVDVFVVEDDSFNDNAFTVFGLSSAASSAEPVWARRFNCMNQDGGKTAKASDQGARLVVQCEYFRSSGGTVFGLDGQTGAILWQYNTTNPLVGTCMDVQVTASGSWVLYLDAFSPDTPNNATVLAGATGAVRDSSIPLPYYSASAAISDSGNFVAVVDEIAVNVYKWSAKRSAYELAYVLAPPPGEPVSGLEDITMSTGRDKDEMIVAMYTGAQSVVIGIWSLADAQLQTTWSRSKTGTFGGLSADGEYVGAALDDGAVLLRRGSNDEVFSFASDVMFAISINVVRSSSGGGDTVFLAAAGGNNGGSKGNTGDAYAFEIDVPAGPSDPSGPSSPASAPSPCYGTFIAASGPETVEEVCFTTLLNSSTTMGLSVRQYPAAAAALASYNVSALYPDSTFDSALTLGSFGVLEYFIGGFNKQRRNILDARTVPFLLLPPAAAGGWVGRMALAPSQFPGGAKAPAPLDNVTLVELSADKLTLAVQRFENIAAFTGPQLATLCADATREIATGALPGYSIDASSPFAAGAFGLYYGRDVNSGPFVAECWLGVSTSARAS